MKDLKGHIIATLLAFVMFILLGLNYSRIEYAFDDWINVLEPTCTYEQYVQDKLSCIKDSYK